MGMFSEGAIESTIMIFVSQIKKELVIEKDKPEVIVALKKLGRFALEQFEWSTPDWAKEYHKLFRE